MLFALDLGQLKTQRRPVADAAGARPADHGRSAHRPALQPGLGERRCIGLPAPRRTTPAPPNRDHGSPSATPGQRRGPDCCPRHEAGSARCWGSDCVGDERAPTRWLSDECLAPTQRFGLGRPQLTRRRPRGPMCRRSVAASRGGQHQSPQSRKWSAACRLRRRASEARVALRARPRIPAREPRHLPVPTRPEGVR